MGWARATVNLGLGVALLDYWSLGPLELSALAKANRGEKTEEEAAKEERDNQLQIAAALSAYAKKQ